MDIDRIRAHHRQHAGLARHAAGRSRRHVHLMSGGRRMPCSAHDSPGRRIDPAGRTTTPLNRAPPAHCAPARPRGADQLSRQPAGYRDAIYRHSPHCANQPKSAPIRRVSSARQSAELRDGDGHRRWRRWLPASPQPIASIPSRWPMCSEVPLGHLPRQAQLAARQFHAHDGKRRECLSRAHGAKRYVWGATAGMLHLPRSAAARDTDNLTPQALPRRNRRPMNFVRRRRWRNPGRASSTTTWTSTRPIQQHPQTASGHAGRSARQALLVSRRLGGPSLYSERFRASAPARKALPFPDR